MEKLVETFIEEQLSIYNFSIKYKIEQEEVIKALHAAGFLYARPKVQYRLIVNLKYAADEFLNNQNINRIEICKKYSINHETFSKYLSDYLKISVDKRVKPAECSTIFDNIDTEEKAYWLGFLYADGAVSSKPLSSGKKNYNVELSLKIGDTEHLKKFYKFSKATTKYIEDSCRCRVTLNDKHLWETLVSYGCSPRKSLTLEFPKESVFKDKKLIRHFIRGYFDGDGYISDSSNNNILAIQVLGTEKFLSTLLSYCPEKLQKLALHHNHGNPDESTMFFNTSYNKALLFLYFIYKDSSIYLNRKYNRFARYISNNINEGSKIGEGCDANTELTCQIAKRLMSSVTRRN